MEYFNTRDFQEGREKRLKEERFDITMDPREWMARNGHTIIAGDMRMYKYEDKAFEAWIYKAFEALTSEGLEKLWKEFLTEEEIAMVREIYRDP